MIKTTKDGRTIRTGADYTKFRHWLYLMQQFSCARCQRHTSTMSPSEDAWSFHVHHIGGRGMGGSKRNDNLDSVEGLCGECHRKEHGQ